MFFLNYTILQQESVLGLILACFCPSGESEEAMAASALDSNIQHATVVNDAGQRVITIVTDQHGNLQTTGGMTQPFFVTMQHGQQSMTQIVSY